MPRPYSRAALASSELYPKFSFPLFNLASGSALFVLMFADFLELDHLGYSYSAEVESLGIRARQ